MSDIEILEEAIKILSRINVPVEQTESIALPVYNVRKMLSILLDAINNARAEKAEKEVVDDAESGSGERADTDD